MNFYVLNNNIVKNENGINDNLLKDLEYSYTDPNIKELNGYTIISDPINEQWEILKNIDEVTYTSIKVSHDMKELNDILKTDDINFINYDSIKINNRIKNNILDNVKIQNEIELILFKNVKSYIDWLMIDDDGITIEYILHDGFRDPNKTFKQIIQDQFINDDTRVSQLENGMILFQYE